MTIEARVLRRTTAIALLICGAGLLGAAERASAQAANPPAQPPARTLQAEIGSTKIRVPFTVAAVGDIIMPQPLRRDDPDTSRLAELIRHADVGFGNMEMSLVDFRTFRGPVRGSVSPLASGQAIRDFGFTLLNHANNHTLDGGVEGMDSTDRALDRLGIVHAGTGPFLQAARAPRYLETPKGRVGLVSMFSTEDVGNFGPTYQRTEATPRNGELGGEAGVNTLHLTTYHIVSPETLQSLQQIAAAAYGDRYNALQTGPGGEQRFRFFDEWYQAGPNPGVLHYEMDAADERGILDSIRAGKVIADFMIASIHVHQTPKYCGQCQAGNTGNGMKEGVDHYPADFVIKLAHDSIDAGADMFIGHGVHAIGGVEIYHGKPIFYDLASFVFQFGLQPGASYDNWENYRRMAELEDPATQEGLLAVTRFENGRLAEIRLNPVDMGSTRRPISRMGIPAVPSPQDAQRILSNVQEYSRPFGTNISIEDNVGVIRIGADGQSAAR
jgi:poly-gamma-glutamate synthesis protein (capsule biosynthesis protein)